MSRLYGKYKGIISQNRKTFVIAIASFLLVVVVAQLLYPRGRLLPLTQIDGQRVGVMDKSQLSDYLEWRYDSREIAVKTGDVTTKGTVSEAGLNPDHGTVYRNAVEYPLWQRLMPFSVLVKALVEEVEPQPDIDAAKLQKFSEKVVVGCNFQPQNAELSVKDSQIILTPSHEGRKCELEAIKDRLSRVGLSDQIVVEAPVEIIPPQRSDAELKPLLTKAKAITDRKISFQVGSAVQDIPRDKLASWIKFSEDEKTKQISLSLDKEKVTEFLNEQEKKIYVSPGTTIISIQDGVEVSRQEGRAGAGMDKSVTAERIEKTLLEDDAQNVIKAVVVALPAKVRYDRNYSNDQAGLDMLLADLVREKGDYGIALRELSGQQRISSASGDRRFITASTYKLFVAYAVLKRVEAGQMTWSQEIVSGRNLDQCFEDMIVKSDNPCASTLGKTIGWKNIQAMLHGLGMGNTFLAQAPTNDNFSTASDEALFLAKLERGELVQGASRERLMSAMKRQVYRKGIPSGTGAVVADKVGFLYGLLHDAAIVYSPRGTYVLVILSDNSTWADIADATRRIETLLNK